jgi:glycosyltransferase involved in cell wall biosynthesis
MTTSLISVVLPVYNQADHVGLVVREYEEALERLPVPHELVLVVNGSTDASLDVCKALEDELDTARGDLLCYTNLARTSPEDLTLLLVYATVQPDVVVKANRKIRDSALRRVASLLYNLECRALFDLSYWDVNGTPKVFPRSFDKLMHLSRDDDLIDVEFNVICRREGYRMLEVPIFSTRRHGGRSTTGYFSAAKLYWGAVGFWRATRNGDS